jgi:4-hydroxy-3-methylbut-2-enyl diphosphate reductase
MGEAPDSMILVETEEDVDKLEIENDAKVAYLTQTTLSVDDANRIIARLRARFTNLVNPPKEDICYATQNRQEAVKKIAAQADVCFVLGSQNSSNSQRLRELAEDEGVSSYLIDGSADLDPKWLDGVETVFMTAGASAPETVVNECIEWLKERFDASVEPVIVREEHVSFPLPKKLRQLQG